MSNPSHNGRSLLIFNGFWCEDLDFQPFTAGSSTKAVWRLEIPTLHTWNSWKSAGNDRFVNVWMLFRAKKYVYIGVWILRFSTLHSRFCKRVWRIGACWWGVVKGWWRVDENPLHLSHRPLFLLQDFTQQRFYFGQFGEYGLQVPDYFFLIGE